MTHVRHEQHHPDFRSEVVLSLHVLDLVLERHRDKRFIEPGDPRMAKGFLGSVTHRYVELRESVE